MNTLSIASAEPKTQRAKGSNSFLESALDGSYFEEITKQIFDFTNLESRKNLRLCNSKIKEFIDDIVIFKVKSFEDAVNLSNKGLKVSYGAPVYISQEKVNKLGNVHKLDLSHCNGITDVSALGNVHSLNLKWCNNIADVSALGNVHTLDLTFCQEITDVSALGNVHTLNLSLCKNITTESGLSALGNVHTLDLSYCKNITDVSALGNVHTLNIKGCDNIKDISCLKGVKNLIK